MKITWRKTALKNGYGKGRSFDCTVHRSLTNYLSKSAAQKQIDIYSKIFPFNTYYIE